MDFQVRIQQVIDIRSYFTILKGETANQLDENKKRKSTQLGLNIATGDSLAVLFESDDHVSDSKFESRVSEHGPKELKKLIAKYPRHSRHPPSTEEWLSHYHSEVTVSD